MEQAVVDMEKNEGTDEHEDRPNGTEEGLAQQMSSKSWSKSLSKLPLFTEKMLDDHLIHKSSTMPDKKATQAYRHKQKGYRLFKEGFLNKIFVKDNVEAGDTQVFIAKAKVSASMKQTSYDMYAHLKQDLG